MPWDGLPDIGFFLKIPVMLRTMPYKYRAKFRDFFNEFCSLSRDF
jgi:hypothetical protein